MRRAGALFHAGAYNGEGRDAEINLITGRVSIAVIPYFPVKQRTKRLRHREYLTYTQFFSVNIYRKNSSFDEIYVLTRILSFLTLNVSLLLDSKL